MKGTATAFLRVALLLGVAACGAPDGQAPRAQESAAERAPARDTHPCDVFSRDDVAATFSVAGDDISASRDAVPGNLACSYEWARADVEAIHERNRQAAMQSLRSGGGVPRFESDTNSLLITFHGVDFPSTDEALRGFDQMVQRLSEGVSSGAGSERFEFQAGFEPSDGIGERAAWSEKLRQVSVVSGTRLFHVSLNTGGERSADRARAEEIARRIAAAL
jgi:hypothetical protein